VKLKVCTKCQKEKPFSEFYKRSSDSVRSSCKECDNQGHKSWVRNNPEKKREITKRWDDKNKDYIKNYSTERRQKHPEKAMLLAAKNRSQKFGLDFNLEEGDIYIPDKCPVFGFPLVMHSGRNGGRFDSPSLDRVNPDKGYVKGNVQVISFKANAMKNNATQEELIAFANWIKKEYD
jgi:hypothetical protein